MRVPTLSAVLPGIPESVSRRKCSHQTLYVRARFIRSCNAPKCLRVAPTEPVTAFNMVSRTVAIAPSSARARAPAQSKFPSDTTVDKGTQGRTAVPNDREKPRPRRERGVVKETLQPRRDCSTAAAWRHDSPHGCALKPVHSVS